MQYVFTMTSRMLAVACACALALCILLFLLGVEIGKTMTGVPLAPVQVNIPGAGSATLSAPAPTAAPPAAAPAAAPAPSTSNP